MAPTSSANTIVNAFRDLLTIRNVNTQTEIVDFLERNNCGHCYGKEFLARSKKFRKYEGFR